MVGSCLPAALFAFNNNCPIFFTEPKKPFRFDHLEPEQDLSFLRLPMAGQNLTTFEGDKNVGAPKTLLWERIFFLLSLNGKVPLSNLCHSMRYNEKSITCSNEYSKIAEIYFNKCVYFGDRHLSGIEVAKTNTERDYTCYDWVAFHKGGKHEIDYLKTKDAFVSEVWFYPSDRIDGNTKVKDACVVSRLSEAQLADFDFSETMARFKLIHEMETRGMKGVFNGYGKTGKAKYYKHRTSSRGREKYSLDTQSKTQSDRFEVSKESEESMLQALQSCSVDYSRFLINL